MSIDIMKIKNWLDLNNINYINDFDLSKKSWLKAGGIIKLFITPKNLRQTIQLRKYFLENNLNFCIV